MSELGVGGGADFASPGGCAAAVGIGGSNGVFGVPGSVGMGTGGVGASGCTGTGGYKPSFVTDEELKQLVCEAGNGFLFVLCCSSLRVSFVTDTVAQVLNVPQVNPQLPPDYLIFLKSYFLFDLSVCLSVNSRPLASPIVSMAVLFLNMTAVPDKKKL